jgi:hypothetical protein
MPAFHAEIERAGEDELVKFDRSLGRPLIASVVCALAAPFLGAASSAGETLPVPIKMTGSKIIDADFNSQALGQVSPTSFNNEFGDTNDDSGAYDSMSYVDDAANGKAVRTKLAAGKYLGSGGNGEGNVLVIALGRTTDSACMSYDVRFSGDFDFSAGGKLPGLLGVAPGTPPSTPTGGGSTVHGWSGRLMWLGPMAYSFAGEGGNDNTAVTYLYHPGQADKWGDNIQWHKPFIDGKWHHVQQCHTLNTVGRSNGVLRAWLDGAPVVNRSDMVYRTDPAVHITHFDWSIFRGGDSMLWAGSRDGYVDLDNVQVTG